MNDFISKKLKIKLITVITTSILSISNVSANSSNQNNTNNTSSIKNGITIINPWARATVAKQAASGVFLSIKSDKQLSLFKIESPIATKSEIHTMVMKDNTMYMHAVDKVDIQKNQTTELNGDYHLMIFGLKQKLQVGMNVPIKLYFKDDNQNIIQKDINAVVKPIYYSEK
ncbi:MAG: hypothetical protein RLZZ210_1332 [Pseudomonadota bacterium]|jgi:copper(I)-binding protein